MIEYICLYFLSHRGSIVFLFSFFHLTTILVQPENKQRCRQINIIKINE